MIDPRTLLTLSGLMYLTLSLLTFLALMRHQDGVVRRWCLWGALTGLVFLLTSNPLDWPHPFQFNLLSTAAATSLLGRALAFQTDPRQDPAARRLLIRFALGYLLVYSLLEWALGPAARAGFARVMAGLCTLAIGMGAAWFAYERRLPFSVLVSVPYTALGLIYLGHGMSTWAGHIPWRLVNDNGWSLLLMWSVFISSILGHVGFMNMMLARILRKDVRRVQSRAASETRQKLLSELGWRDRQWRIRLLTRSLNEALRRPLNNTLDRVQHLRHTLGRGRAEVDPVVQELDGVIHNTQEAATMIGCIRSLIRPSWSQPASIVVQDTVNSLLALVREDFRQRQVTLHLQLPSTPIQAIADPVQVSHVVLNVLSNAAEAMAGRPDAELQLQLSANDQEWTLKVSDNGPGFPVSVLTHQPGPQDALSPVEGGWRVGLSVSHAMVRAHGGSLLLFNRAEGGACVEIRLPLSGPPSDHIGASEPPQRLSQPLSA